MGSGRIFRTSVCALVCIGLCAAQDFGNQGNASKIGDLYQTLTIESPRLGQQLEGSSITIVLSVGRNLNRHTLLVRLNGKDISSQFHDGACRGNACLETANVTTSEGLQAGHNRLRASANATHSRYVAVKRVSFDYSEGVGITSTGVSPYLPPSVGLSLNPGGAQPWVSLMTGTPASLEDNIDQTQYSVPYHDATFPGSSEACASNYPYQILVLARPNPASQLAYSCATDSTNLKDTLASYASSYPNALVIAGTTLGNYATPGLNTTAIGGTDYSNTQTALYPKGYAIIGVLGAKAGSAYENYWVPGTAAMPLQYAPWAYGTLAADENGNYSFHPSDNRIFTISPNDRSAGTSVIAIGNQTYHAPNGSANGFWLLVIDRMLLQPIDSSTTPNATCPYDAGLTSGCGTFFPTGNSDSSTASGAVANLASALTAVSPRSLAILTSVGQPFANASAVSEDLASAIVLLGGSRFTLPKLTTANSTYSLIAPGATSPRSQFASGLATSSSAFSQQHQTGYVIGVLARDLTSLYAPTVSAQADGAQNGIGAVSVTPDFSFYEISSQSPVDWPLTDTSSHIAAYHYASAQYLTRHFQETGSHSQDLRYFYPGNPGIGQYNTDFLPNSPFYPTYPTGATFTQQDLTDASAQLYQELTALNDANNYLGDTALRGLFAGNNGASVADDVIAATYSVLNGQVGATPGTSVSMNPSGWMNLLAGLAAIPAAALGPLDLPIAAAGFGVASGILWSGSAAQSPFDSATTPTPPSYENTFDTTLGTLEQNAQMYQANLMVSYDTALDNIYSDWGRLQTVGQKTANSDSGWSFTDQLTVDLLGNNLAAGVNRSLYLQLLPQFYQLDTYASSPASDVSKLGMYYQGTIYPYGSYWSCNAAYPSGVPANGYSIYHHIGASSSGTDNDIFVIGGTINDQGSYKVKETLPTEGLLNTLFAPDPNGGGTPGYLNLPADPFYSSNQASGGYLTYRTGPNQGQGLCYDPGCYSTIYKNKCQ